MGFDYTCALSELPITAGTPILVVPLVEFGLGLNGGANSRFSPAFPPLEGLYDDHGFAEHLKPQAFHHATARALGRADAYDLMSTLRACSQTPIMVQTVNGILPLVFALARKDSWDAMVRLPVPFGYSPDETTGWDLSHKACAQGAHILSQIPNIDRKIIDLDTEVNNGSYSHARMALMLLRTQLNYGGHEDDAFLKMFEQNIMQPQRGTDAFTGTSTLKTLAMDMPLAGCSVGEIEEGLQLCAQTILCGHHMHALRKIWLDRDSCGPQHGALALHWLWTRKLSQLASSDVDWDSEDSNGVGFKPAVEARRADRAAMEALSISEATAQARSRPKLPL